MKDDALLAFIPDHLAAVNRTAAVLMYRDAYSAFWHTVSAGYMLAVVRRTARALLSVGLGRGSRVIILSENRPECFYTSFAAYRIGAVNVPLMRDMSAEGVAEALRATGARLIMAGSQQAYDAALAACRLVRRHIRIVTFSRSVKPVRSDRTTVTFAAFTEPFRAAGLSIAPPTGSDEADIIFTSGTTGRPKGAVITHSMYEAAIRNNRRRLPDVRGWHVLEYLPLSHVFERAWALFCITGGAVLALNRQPSHVQRSMREIRPEAMCCVPRFWEKYIEAVDRYADKAAADERALMQDAIRTGETYNADYRYMQRPAPPELETAYRRADATVLRRIRTTAGLERAKLLPTAGAVVPEALVRRIRSYGLPILVGYGMTETTATVSCDDFRRPCTPGSVGRVIDGVQLTIAPDGEILLEGDTIIKRYLDQEIGGPLHAGDAGRMSPDGELYIIGRIKDLLKTSTGDYVAPEWIEARIEAAGEVDRCIVVAEGRKFASALIFPSRTLLDAVAREEGIDPGDSDTLLRSPLLRRRIREAIDAAQKGVPAHSSVRRFMIAGGELTMENGCLTPTLKPRRFAIEARYRDAIDTMYDNGKYEIYDNV